jgi:hypothetical protein
MCHSAIRLWLASDYVKVAIFVWDASLDPPVVAAPQVYAEHGRGLLLVEKVSARWGWHYPVDSGGKVVWAVVDAASAARTDY